MAIRAPNGAPPGRRKASTTAVSAATMTAETGRTIGSGTN